MKSCTRRIALLAAAALGACAWLSPAVAEEPAPEGAGRLPAVKEGAVLDPSTPVAVVNGAPITKDEFDRAMQGYLRQFQRVTGNMHGEVAEPNDQMRADVMKQLVDRELLYQESLKDPLPDPAERVDAEMATLRARFPNDEEMDKALAAQGLTRDQLRDLMGRQVQVRHYLEQAVIPGIQVDEATVQKFYDDNIEKFATPEQVRCSHILIRVDPGAAEDERKTARDQAQQIQTRCVAGEPFAELAKELSQDPGSAKHGGDLGFFSRERMVTPFSDAAFALQPGEVSDVVETRFGYHVIKLMERKEATQQAFAEVKESIENYLKSQALDAAVKEKVAVLREAATIDVLTPHM